MKREYIVLIDEDRGMMPLIVATDMDNVAAHITDLMALSTVTSMNAMPTLLASMHDVDHPNNLLLRTVGRAERREIRTTPSDWLGPDEVMHVVDLGNRSVTVHHGAVSPVAVAA